MPKTIQKMYNPHYRGPYKNEVNEILKLFNAGLTISEVETAMKIIPGWIARWIKDYPEIGKVLINANQRGIDFYEREARRRAVDGFEVTKEIYDGEGELKGREVIHQYDSKLLALLLKSRDPARFGSNSTQNININNNIDRGKQLRDARVRAQLPDTSKPIDVEPVHNNSDDAT